MYSLYIIQGGSKYPALAWIQTAGNSGAATSARDNCLERGSMDSWRISVRLKHVSPCQPGFRTPIT